MGERAIDAMSRRAAGVVSRRGSLLTLSSLGLAAAIPGVSPVKAAKNRKERKKLCRRQVAPCQAFFAGLCSGDPDCEAEFFPFCNSLANCDSAGMLQCLFFCGCSELNDLVTTAQQP